MALSGIDVLKGDGGDAVAIACLFERVGYLGFKMIVNEAVDVGIGKRFSHEIKKVADGGQDTIKIGAVRFAERGVAPVIVCSAEYEHGIDSVFLKKAVFDQLIQSIDERRGFRAVGVVIAGVADRGARPAVI